ncbi:serine hydrolase [Paramicrobacterium agarici]|uniref:serine hydrolase n=1 Tax=Paramicrobacterium agarici TaxID=630514 RepID=UPI00114FD527|nr:serine hydrolase [Microbacterium agarici]TQO22521.1 beta-lactamase class A [Microbacterium agarici]
MASPTREPGRRVRPSARRARHRSDEPADTFASGFRSLALLARNGVQVSARSIDLASGRELFSIDDYIVMPTAGIGTSLLLADVAARLDDPAFESLMILDRETQDQVGDAGLWQHLQAPSLPIADLAALVAASNDHLAMNVLLRQIGLDAVRLRAEHLGLRRTALLDLARDHRGPDDAPHLSVGSMKELTWLFAEFARGEAISPAASQRVVDWLSLNMDLSLVASAFGLDPLAHRSGTHGLTLFNKTGSAPGVRAEAGVLRGPRSGVAYAVATSFTDTDLLTRLAVVDGMRAVGSDLLEYVH